MNKTIKKFLVVTLSIALVFSLTLPVYAKNNKDKGRKVPKVVLKVATPFREGHILADTAEKFKELVEQSSKGKIAVIIEAGLDTEENVNLRCASGDVDIQLTGGEPLEVFSPEYFFFNAPYVIKDYDHFLRVWNGPLGDESKALISENGNMKSLGTVFRGYRQMTSNKPISGPSDIANIKLRLPGVHTWISVWSQIGANPVAVPLTGLYQALADGTAEASEGDLTQIMSFNLAEVQSHLTITNHLCAVGYITINNDTYNSLKKQERRLVERAMKEASEWATQVTMDSDNARLEYLQNAGMTLGYPDADAIRELAKPAIEELFINEWPVTTWEEVLAQ
ncbi:TRAP-type C4-dicarboxylate transport system substrate-binding protein [Natranaerovirga pectinivora]|uniref:TRAP-type C4-dicarboxylate transport system substrate-binding protein n=1 Tax=Natranaerovirga pectinivora TaxID=682400 RepID=A0A4R3MRH2_9FIRM|nr:TRAP transporter substrate-binding protein [Natranaerovirga pectinivora]TCT17113.1 TRAP-type C4-dicarboxylate transport system substrate-binding protein [Natranaerovirga pectinivora]